MWQCGVAKASLNHRGCMSNMKIGRAELPALLQASMAALYVTTSGLQVVQMRHSALGKQT